MDQYVCLGDIVRTDVMSEEKAFWNSYGNKELYVFVYIELALSIIKKTNVIFKVI